MTPTRLLSTLLLMSGAVAACAQPSPPASTGNGLELLTEVAKQYTDAKSYFITATEEQSSTSELGRSWQKSILTASEATGNRSFFEGRSEYGHSLKLSDGKTVWTYRVLEHRYTAKPVVPAIPGTPIVMEMPDGPRWEAENLRKKLGDMAKHLKSAERLPDATLTVNGQDIACELVHVGPADQKRPSPDYTLEKTIWIEKQHRTVLKTVERGRTQIISGAARVPIDEEITTTFTAELDAPPRNALFTFVPPPGSLRIDNFPDPLKNFGQPDLSGSQVPSLQLKSADGKIVPLDSFRGKPVLLDLWATWCGPCVAAMPQLASLQKETRDKGLILLTIDRDEEASTAADFLAKKGYTWRNFHDGDGEIEKLLGPSGVPRTLLIDATGKITYDATGGDEEALRTAIAKLGPEYAASAPKPKSAPCVAAK